MIYGLEKTKVCNLENQNEIIKEANNKFIMIIREY